MTILQKWHWWDAADRDCASHSGFFAEEALSRQDCRNGAADTGTAGAVWTALQEGVENPLYFCLQ